MPNVSRRRNLTHDCRWYHTGGYFVIGINHEILLEIRSPDERNGHYSVSSSPDIFLPDSRPLFQMVGRDNRAFKNRFQTTPAKHAAQVGFLSYLRQTADGHSGKASKEPATELSSNLFIGRNPYIGYIKVRSPRGTPDKHGGSRQCRIGKKN